MEPAPGISLSITYFGMSISPVDVFAASAASGCTGRDRDGSNAWQIPVQDTKIFLTKGNAPINQSLAAPPD
jgi:hypothetical protein